MHSDTCHTTLVSGLSLYERNDWMAMVESAKFPGRRQLRLMKSSISDEGSR